MLSIIICSISPERLEQVSRNIHDTIGAEYEIIAIDNRDKKWPIARAYNEGARKARYPFLFFVHEDVKFHTKGWGPFIESKLEEPDCGAIGFAGSQIKFRAYSGWPQFNKWKKMLLFQGRNESSKLEVMNVTLEQPFEEVVVLDGLGLFVPWEVWSMYPFDEVMLTGFHCYDIDFSLQIAAGQQYKNYVCCSPKVLIEHFSAGLYSRDWYRETIRMHKQKWSAILPLKVNSIVLCEKTLRKFEERCFNTFLRDILGTNYPERKQVLQEFLCYPISWKHFVHCISAVRKYFFSH